MVNLASTPFPSVYNLSFEEHLGRMIVDYWWFELIQIYYDVIDFSETTETNSQLKFLSPKIFGIEFNIFQAQ